MVQEKNKCRNVLLILKLKIVNFTSLLISKRATVICT